MNSPMDTSAFSGTTSWKPADNLIASLAFPGRRVQEPLHEWRPLLLERLNELCSLPAGWDGYAAPPVSFANAYFALSMLDSACPYGTPKPQIVPGSNGDLQIEWHTQRHDIELHVRDTYDVNAWLLTSAAGDKGTEEHLVADFRIVAVWLQDILGETIASRSAAA